MQECGIIYVPLKAIIVYTIPNFNKLSKELTNGLNSHYAEEARLKNINGEYVLDQLFPLKKNDLAELSRMFGKSKNDKLLKYFKGNLNDISIEIKRIIEIDAAAASFSFEMMEHESEMSIKTNAKVVKRLVIYPKTIFEVHVGDKYLSLSVTCFDALGNQIPIPYMNTSSSVCMGSAQIPKEDNIVEGALSVYEHFTSSSFTENHGNITIRGFEDKRDFWLNYKFKDKFPSNLFSNDY